MIPLPFAPHGFGRHSHCSALWWLGLLYRRPAEFHKALQSLPQLLARGTGLTLYLHAVPYLFLFCVFGRLLLFEVFDLSLQSVSPELSGVLWWHVRESAGGIVVGLAGGLAIAFAIGLAEGITVGLTFGLAFGLAGGLTGEIPFGLIFGLAFGLTIGVAGGLVFGLVFGVAVGAAVGLAGGLAFGLAGGTALLRAYYYLLHFVFMWPSVHGQWYPYHPVAWDDLCALPFPGLHRLLLAYAAHAPQAAEAEVERLINAYPSQRMAALRARAVLIAREAGRQQDLTRLSLLVNRLPEGDTGFLAQTSHIREWVNEIAQQQTRLHTIDRPVFREPLAQTLRTEIENFVHRVSGFHEPLKSEFGVAAQQWLEIADRQLAAARSVTTKEPTPQVFRAGDPVDRSREAFVPRNSIFGDLERQIMLSTGCPALVLYGRRRMGKSTILRNMAGFLPSSVRVAVITMEDIKAFSSLESLVGLLATEMLACWPGHDKPQNIPRNLAAFRDFLAQCNQAAAAVNCRVLLALDEYEYLDAKIGEGVFSLDLLALIRTSIQAHRQLTWVFAGSHEIAELTHAPWASYLVSARTIEVSPFTEAETRLLLTEPLKYSSMWPPDDPRCPRFAPVFWGEGGIERINAEADGWPHLVQLIAETVVDLVNDEGVSQATPDLLERALSKAIVSGDTVLRQLVQGESRLPGEWDYVSRFRRVAVQSPPDDEALYQSLRRRMLVAEAQGQWRLRVPLMQRWLQVRG